MKHSTRFLAVVDAAKSRVRETTVENVRADLEAGADFELIDVREDREWDLAHAAGARHLGKGVIERDIERLIPEPATKIVLYCAGGYRSALAADALQQMGYSHVYSMAGGWRAWNAAAMPVERGQAK